ncbi:MAG: lysozyme [Candidatus Liberibacter europaeus]|uniref:Lysozyme n=1 Tax=Candidatus Liberibacter europaeus TaxID=744859 RepID=A0A2T4VWC0_9HYPH|nr:lysozyme [Candidatus Liberibacter europaeus]PTL86076.1 MAG: lysozyme [Candidatus Liberibacter europaeus]
MLLDLIIEFEGLRLKSYQDPAGVWTIGYGHTGPDVVEGMVITQPQVYEFLIQDASQCIRQTFEVSPIIKECGANRISAIGDFVYNLGIGNYRSSTLRKRVDVKDWDGAVDEIKKWVHVGKKTLPGLVRRRNSEACLLLMGGGC